MKKWYEYKTPTGSFFSPFTSSDCKVKSFTNPENMSDFLNAHSNSYNIVSDSLVEVYDDKTASGEEIELPCGIYSHEFGNPGRAERLEPMAIREDKYIDLIESLKDLDNEVSFFLDSKNLYDKSMTMYKLGILLFGPPGCGKSCYIREFVKKHKAIVIYLDNIPSRNFLERLNADTKDTLKIFIFEEVVSQLEDSSSIKEMLELLDGSMTVSNSIYFMSTNYPDAIPENIIRNGRVDVFVKVEFPNEADRIKLFNLYLDRSPTEDELRVTEKLAIVDIRHMCFLHKKNNQSFVECAKLIKEKNDMIKKHFGRTKEIRLT